MLLSFQQVCVRTKSVSKSSIRAHEACGVIFVSRGLTDDELKGSRNEWLITCIHAWMKMQL